MLCIHDMFLLAQYPIFLTTVGNCPLFIRCRTNWCNSVGKSSKSLCVQVMPERLSQRLKLPSFGGGDGGGKPTKKFRRAILKQIKKNITSKNRTWARSKIELFLDVCILLFLFDRKWLLLAAVTVFSHQCKRLTQLIDYASRFVSVDTGLRGNCVLTNFIQ